MNRRNSRILKLAIISEKSDGRRSMCTAKRDLQDTCPWNLHSNEGKNPRRGWGKEGMGLLWGSPSADISTAFSSSFTLRDSRKRLPWRYQPLNDRRQLQKTRKERGHHSKGCALHKSRACSPVSGSCLVTRAAMGLAVMLLESLYLHGVRQPGVHASAFCKEVLNNEKEQYAAMSLSQLWWAGWILRFLSPVSALRAQPLNWGWNRDPPGSFLPKRWGVALWKS